MPGCTVWLSASVKKYGENVDEIPCPVMRTAVRQTFERLCQRTDHPLSEMKGGLTTSARYGIVCVWSIG